MTNEEINHVLIQAGAKAISDELRDRKDVPHTSKMMQAILEDVDSEREEPIKTDHKEHILNHLNEIRDLIDPQRGGVVGEKILKAARDIEWLLVKDS